MKNQLCLFCQTYVEIKLLWTTKRKQDIREYVDVTLVQKSSVVIDREARVPIRIGSREKNNILSDISSLLTVGEDHPAKI